MSNARFSILQAKAVSDQRITNAQFRSLAALGMYGDKEGWCFPKLQTIATMLGKSRQAVSRDLQILKELGYIQIRYQHRKDGSQMHNLYRLIFDPPPQQEAYPHQQGVDTPSTPDVDPPSASEVDALTPQYNAPYNLEEEGENSGNIFKVYEQEIGIITPMIADELRQLEQEHPQVWIEQAIQEASKNGKRSLGYFKAILNRWKVEGYGSEFKKTNNRKASQPQQIRSEAEMLAALEARRGNK